MNVRGDVYWPPTRRSRPVVETPRSIGHRRHQYSQLEASTAENEATGASASGPPSPSSHHDEVCHMVRAVAGCGVGNSPSVVFRGVPRLRPLRSCRTAYRTCQIPLRILCQVVTACHHRSHVGSILDGSPAISASDKSPHSYNGMIRPTSRRRPRDQAPRSCRPRDQQAVDT